MDYIDLGQRIRTARKRKCMTLEAFAEAVNISVSYAGLIERGKRAPSLETLVKICQVLSISADYLLDICGERPIDIQMTPDEKKAAFALLELALKAVRKA